MSTPRAQKLWFAAFVHRISGIALAVFLPFHFLVLGLSLESAEALDGFLHWADHPLVKFAEMGLVLLLTVHLFGGLRLLVLENFGWNERQSLYASAAGGISIIVGFAFLFRVF